jgi:hypothetical protein
VQTIQIKIDRQGNAEVKPQGFTGDTCLEALRPLEALIGSPDERERTAEAFESAQQSQDLQQGL